MGDEDGNFEEYIWIPVGTCNKIAGAHVKKVKVTKEKVVKKKKA